MEAVERLRTLAARLPAHQQPRFGTGAQLDQIEKLEKSLGAPLPADFREFLLTWDEVVAMEVHNGYWIGGIRMLLRSGESSYGSVVVATDGAGNAFVMGLTGSPAVWKRERDSGGRRRVADSFTHFLSIVADDWEHFAANDTAWHYLSG